MGQIEKRKKGRPSKADLAARRAAVESDAPPSEQQKRDIRRSLRRRSFRYNIIDYDEDYLNDDVHLFDGEDDVEEREEEDEDEDEAERRREKKLKLVLKLNNNSSKKKNRASRGSVRVGLASRRDRVDSSESESEEEEERREVKKRRINGGRGEEDYDDDDGDDENGENDEDEGFVGKVESKRRDSVPGTPTDNNHSPTPLPDKKQLELILDKLQKKDTYGVYAEPVDPEELPDYLDIIEHPMDFSTVRKKLTNGSYSTLKQFENDVFLISSNAMQYNAPETIYHRQARAIKELAEKKFQRVRIHIERLEKETKSEINGEPKSELKSELRDRPNLLVKKQPKKPLCRSIQEPLGSDFSSGATLATVDAHNTCSIDPVGSLERSSNNDGLVEGISFLADNNTEKAEDPQSGKSVIPKFGRRSFVVDENRRATYNISNQPIDRSESIFTPFEDEKKQLIPVGLPGEYSYARSLARFSANLGPIAWRIASKRIEQVLPLGFKYGRGWIGEYEPLPTAMLVLEGRKEYPFVSRSHDAADSGKNDKHPECTAPSNAHLLSQPSSDSKPVSIFGSEGLKPPTPTVSVTQQQNPPPYRSSGGPENMMVKRVESNCLSANNQKNIGVFQQQNHYPRDKVCPENKNAKRVEPNTPSIYNIKTEHAAHRPLCGGEMGAKRTEPNSPSTSNQNTDHVVQKQSPPGMETPKGKNFLQSLPFKHPDANGGNHEGLQNGKPINNFMDSNRVTPSFPQRQDQGLSDPVLVMKMLTEKAQKQQNGSVHAQSPSQARPSVPSPRGDNGSHAAAAAASAWMSVGALGFRPAAQNPAAIRSQISADPLYNGMQMFYPQAMQSHVEYPVQPEKKGFPFQTFVPQPVKVGNDPRVQNRQMVFPQMVTNDLSRFQVQAPWRGLSQHTQQKQKQDTLPPDLNVAFQSVDSQQPDLALQL